MNIRTKDLNLLSLFVTVAEELNLSRASARLGLSQPAMSHALARLRREFDDPLFIRGPRGLVATPRVSELLPNVQQLLAAAELLYSPAEFNLSKVRRKVVIACTTYFEAYVMGRLMHHLQRHAPNVEVETRALSGGFPKTELETGEYDLAIAAYFEGLPEGFRVKSVLKEPFACVSGKRNPYLRSERALKDFLAAKHLQIEVPPGHTAHVDQYLRSKGKSREITLRIGNFLTPPSILAETDLLLTCPRSLAERYAQMHALEVTELPFRLPMLETKMVWHEKNQRDAFHTWLRGAIVEDAESR